MPMENKTSHVFCKNPWYVTASAEVAQKKILYSQETKVKKDDLYPLIYSPMMMKQEGSLKKTDDL